MRPNSTATPRTGSRNNDRPALEEAPMKFDDETTDVLIGGYLSKDAAQDDYEAVLASGGYLHGAVVVSKDLQGNLAVEQTDHMVREGAAGLGAVGFAVLGPSIGSSDTPQYLTATAATGTVAVQAVATGTVQSTAAYGLSFGADPEVISSASNTGGVDAFLQGLSELGSIDGETLRHQKAIAESTVGTTKGSRTTARNKDLNGSRRLSSSAR
jgi:hypothetical protein